MARNEDGHLDLSTLIRQAIYARTAATGHVPTIAEIARRTGVDPADARAVCRALADAHVIILKPDERELWAAPPFSAVPTFFRVHANDRSWYAPCAWDAFGIPAALREDVEIYAHCAWSGEPLRAGVSDGVVFGEGLIHLEVPARHFWDDIIYT
jgi:alkylmercury lyase-like protein